MSAHDHAFLARHACRPYNDGHQRLYVESGYAVVDVRHLELPAPPNGHPMKELFIGIYDLYADAFVRTWRRQVSSALSYPLAAHRLIASLVHQIPDSPRCRKLLDEMAMEKSFVALGGKPLPLFMWCNDEFVVALDGIPSSSPLPQVFQVDATRRIDAMEGWRAWGKQRLPATPAVSSRQFLVELREPTQIGFAVGRYAAALGKES